MPEGARGCALARPARTASAGPAATAEPREADLGRERVHAYGDRGEKRRGGGSQGAVGFGAMGRGEGDGDEDDESAMKQGRLAPASTHMR